MLFTEEQFIWFLNKTKPFSSHEVELQTTAMLAGHDVHLRFVGKEYQGFSKLGLFPTMAV